MFNNYIVYNTAYLFTTQLYTTISHLASNKNISCGGAKSRLSIIYVYVKLVPIVRCTWDTTVHIQNIKRILVLKILTVADLSYSPQRWVERVPFMIWSPRMQISPGWLRPKETAVSMSTIFISAFLTTLPHAPDFISKGSFANAKHIASTGPASVIP